MRDAARIELDRIDKLKVGAGMLEAFAFGRGDLRSGIAGGAIEYDHRLSPTVSAFGRGELGYRYGSGSDLSFKALAGVRWIW